MARPALCAPLLFAALSLAGCAPAAPPAPAAVEAPASAPPTVAAPASSASAAAPPAPTPTPISGELPVAAGAHVGPLVRCEQRVCGGSALLPAEVVPEPGAPAVVWTIALSSNDFAAVLPRHAAVDVYGVVLEGQVTLRGDGPKEEGVALRPWSAFVAPGAGLRLVAQGGPARVVVVPVTGGAPLAEALAPAGKGASPGWTMRPGAIEITALDGAADLAWGGGAMHARLGFEGARKASLGVLMASKDAKVAPHQHDTSWEVLAALTASGTAGRASGPGQEALAAVPVSDGSVVLMPIATRHAWTPRGDAPLVAIQLYVPPGPEQRFKKLAATP